MPFKEYLFAVKLKERTVQDLFKLAEKKQWGEHNQCLLVLAGS